MTVTSVGSVADERTLIEGARRGEGDAFGRLVKLYRTELHAHCYRLLGSVHDADDALQDALLRIWRGLPGFDDRRPFRPWLYKIATNVCLDLMARRPRRWLPVDYGPTGGAGPQQPPAAWVEPYPDEHLRLPVGMPRPRPVTSSGRRWNWPSSWRCSICPPGSALYSSSATCWASRPGTRPSCSVPRQPRCTAPCNAPGRPSGRGFPARASRKPCGRWATNGSASSRSAWPTPWKRDR